MTYWHNANIHTSGVYMRRVLKQIPGTDTYPYCTINNSIYTLAGRPGCKYVLGHRAAWPIDAERTKTVLVRLIFSGFL